MTSSWLRPTQKMLTRARRLLSHLLAPPQRDGLSSHRTWSVSSSLVSTSDSAADSLAHQRGKPRDRIAVEVWHRSAARCRPTGCLADPLPVRVRTRRTRYLCAPRASTGSRERNRPRSPASAFAVIQRATCLLRSGSWTADARSLRAARALTSAVRATNYRLAPRARSSIASDRHALFLTSRSRRAPRPAGGRT